MKLLLLLCILCGPVWGQPPATNVVLQQVPAEGLVLESGWKFHPGDNPAWAAAAFDDRAWDPLNPVRPVRDLSPRARAGIGWLRLRFRVGAPLRRRPLLLLASYTGAAEIYLNGQLLQREGTLAPQPADVRPRRSTVEPAEVQFDGPDEQVLAVRLAPWQGPALLRSLGESPLLAVRVVGARSFREQQAEISLTDSMFLVLSGVFLLLALLHWAFFRYNQAQRANLYFAFYALAVAGYSLGQYPFAFLRVNTELVVYALTNALIYLSTLWAVRALYALFAVGPGRMYAGLWLSTGLLLPLSVCLVPYGANDYCYAAFLVLATADQLRLTRRAGLQRKRGAGIIGAGFATGLLFLLVLLLLAILHVKLSVLVGDLFVPLIYLPPGLGISWYLAREFALDSQLLALQLREVERLSARTLAQEQEKQALLNQQNDLLERQVRQRTAELERSLAHLQATQAQLVQAEKMAGLGELAAGIAHEIQNPLNFVNNFSEVSAELCQEAQALLAATHLPGAEGQELTALLADLGQNQAKITQHGQRAARIVRGMVEHSRASTGERQPTDLNALAAEYLRIAYQGLRTRDQGCHAELRTDFAPQLPLVNAAGADIGRVLINLLNNAFYAVQQRQHQLPGQAGYAPTVRVSTAHVGNRVELRVADNGTGMPAEVQQKIFQPFFTTKPTGEGTGLGLSLSYDIVTQGHGGTLRAESREGEGTEFIISLPV